MPQPGQVSQTALMVAAYRGRASAQPNPVCDDPWAAGLSGEHGLALSQRWDRSHPNMVLWIGLRTRYIDACVRSAVARGVGQVVVLGAGLDTRAARLARSGVTFFEVDLPATQQAKREMLDALEGYPVDPATYVECDFESGDFVDALVASGWRAAMPSLFVWEGVVYYLYEDAARQTLRRFSQASDPRSVLVFDYLNTNIAQTGDRLNADDKALRDMVDDLGEPMRFGIDDLVPLMHQEGLKRVRSVSFDSLALQYTGTYDRERAFRFQSIATVSVRGDVALC